MARAKQATKVIASNCHLWIYSSKDGKLTKYDNIDIHQRINPYTEAELSQWYAKSPDIDRIVSGLEYSVWYYNGKREYLIWSQSDDDEKIRYLMFKTLKQQSNEKIATALELIKTQHDILEKANMVFSNSNIQIVAGSYEEVEKSIKNYFYNL